MTALPPNVTDFLGIPYPAAETDPFYDVFEGMVKSMEQVMLYGKVMANMFVTAGGTLTWDGTSGLLSWSAPFQIVVPHWGFRITVAYGPDGLAPAAGLADGQCLVVKVPQSMAANVTTNFAVVSQLNVHEHNNFVCATRLGSKLYLRSNGVLT